MITGALLLGLAIAPPAGEPRWTDVAPIVHRRCAGCHHATGPAPFELITRNDIERRARFIAHVIDRDLMPPWLPDDRGLPLPDANELTPHERATLLDWLASDRQTDHSLDADHSLGADDALDLPLGPAADAAPAPDRILTMSDAWPVPAEGPPDMRSFVLPVGNAEPWRLRAIGYRARSPRAVHTATFLADVHGIGRRLDDSTPPPGYEAMGDVGARVSGVTGGIGPGLPWFPLPDGFVWELPPYSDLIAEVHFVPRGLPQPIQDEVHLYMSDDSTARPVHGLWLADIEIDVPPGAADHVLSDEIVLPFAFDVVALLPRALSICVSLELRAIDPSGEETVCLSIPRWDPHYRRPYPLAAPHHLPAGTRLSARWRLDNSEANLANPRSPPGRVRLGPEQTDEYVSMLLLGAPVAPATGADLEQFVIAQARARVAARKH